MSAKNAAMIAALRTAAPHVRHLAGFEDLLVRAADALEQAEEIRVRQIEVIGDVTRALEAARADQQRRDADLLDQWGDHFATPVERATLHWAAERLRAGEGDQ